MADVSEGNDFETLFHLTKEEHSVGKRTSRRSFNMLTANLLAGGAVLGGAKWPTTACRRLLAICEMLSLLPKSACRHPACKGIRRRLASQVLGFRADQKGLHHEQRRACQTCHNVSKT
jgi:hypothetical protein